MTQIILIIVFIAILLVLMVYCIEKSLSKNKKGKTSTKKSPRLSLPSGKDVPSRAHLAQMNARQLLEEYSKADLKWLRDYALKQLPNIPLNADSGYIRKHMAWIDISREIDIALYGWVKK